jgi:hypothetical protein
MISLVNPVLAATAKDLMGMLSTAETSLNIAESVVTDNIWKVKIEQTRANVKSIKNYVAVFEQRELYEKIELPVYMIDHVSDAYKSAMETSYYSQLNLLDDLLKELSVYDKSLSESYRAGVLIPSDNIPKLVDVERLNKRIFEVRETLAKTRKNLESKTVAIKVLDEKEPYLMELVKKSSLLGYQRESEEFQKLLADMRDRRKVLSGVGSDAVSAEDLFVRMTTLENQFFEKMKVETAELIKTNKDSEYADANKILSDSLAGNTINLADSLNNYRKQSKEIEAAKAEKREKRNLTLGLVGFGLISVLLFRRHQKAKQQRKEAELARMFKTQLTKRPSGSDFDLFENPVAQKLGKRITEAERQVLWGESYD